MNIKISVKAYCRFPSKKEKINVSMQSTSSKKFEMFKLQVQLFQYPLKQDEIILSQKKLRLFSKKVTRKPLMEEYMIDQD